MCEHNHIHAEKLRRCSLIPSTLGFLAMGGVALAELPVYEAAPIFTIGAGLLFYGQHLNHKGMQEAASETPDS